ncbi:ATP-dependent DNA helicase RecG [Nocardia sp. NPDC052566]|uniref:ATP-dependent DNA helicase RecG n=1 Tax=Nocardia sp. NPDC052566 TaxID=3364330 RepID=UPI0037CC3030
MTDSLAALRTAVRTLLNAGTHTAILEAADRADTWHPVVADRIRDHVRGYTIELDRLGVDTRSLFAESGDPANSASCGFGGGPPRPPTDPALSTGIPKPQFNGIEPVAERSRHQVEVVTIPTLSASAALRRRANKPDLEFEGTLDGLRGVPITDLAGISGDAGLGDKELRRLTAAGISSVYDLMMRVPLRYIDRSRITPLRRLLPGMTSVATVGKVTSAKADWEKRYSRIEVADGPVRLTSMQFQQPWTASRYKPGDLLLLWGDVTEWQGRLQMPSALLAPMHDVTVPLVPVYPQSDKHQVSSWMLARAALDALRRLPRLEDPLPERIRTARNLPPRLDALRAVHVPDNTTDATTGRNRLAYDELLRLQLAMGAQRHAAQQQPAVVHTPTGHLTRPWLTSLPWPLTGAQRRSLSEVADDLRRPRPMKRLIQGDVGSGKTQVLIAAMLLAAESGHQSALMAPLGVLVQQHYDEIAEVCTKLGIRACLLPGANKARARREALAGLASGQIQIAVGTTGLLSEDVVFHRLGLAVIDEQHRFGVEQRAALLAKAPHGAIADELGATATPIPRTAAMTVWGDTDISVIDEMPPGRTPIATSWEHSVPLDDGAHPHWRDVRAQIEQGRQGFVVCPLVAEPETRGGQESEAQAAAAIDTAQALRSGALAGVRVEVVTGRQKPAERGEIMSRFVAGEVDVLVATTVIEVGVSVPNATSITILDAGQFGLAQLHQLRGRVGRGKYPGTCKLTGDLTEAGQQRIDAMCSTTNGFELAEIDLRLRGPGALAGTAQAGHRAGLLVADLLADAELMVAARADAATLLDSDPYLERRPTLRAEVERALGANAHYLQRS